MYTTLHVVSPTPAHGERAALKPDRNPALIGKGNLDLLCGGCGGTLAKGIWQGQLFDLGIICSECAAFNDTPSAVGGIVFGRVLYFPVGPYRLSAPVEVPKGAPAVGELFPGAGPPRSDGLVTYGA